MAMPNLARSAQASKQELSFVKVIHKGQVRGIFQQANNTGLAIRHECSGKRIKNFISKEQVIDGLIS
jgi:hypothetical protein